MSTKQFGLCLVVPLLVALSAPSRADDIVKIGFAAPMTGAQAEYGADMKNGVTLAIDDFNATKPTLGGRPVKFELSAEDDQADPRMATMVAQRLIDSGIKGMIGHFNSGTSIPASDLYEKAGIPEIAMATSPVFTARGYKTTFRLMTSDSQAGQIVGKYVVQNLHYKRIAIIDDRTAYGEGAADEFEAAVKHAGGTIIERDFTNDKAVDFSAILTSLKGQNPDAVFYGGGDAQSAPMIRKMRALEMKAAFVTGEMSKSPNFLKVAGPAADGAIVYLAGLPQTKMPGFASFDSRYKARFHSDVVTYAPYSYDGTMALLNAMKQADSADPQKYLPVLAKIQSPGVTTQTISYDGRGDLNDAGLTIYKVVGGDFKPIEIVSSGS